MAIRERVVKAEGLAGGSRAGIFSSEVLNRGIKHSINLHALRHSHMHSHILTHVRTVTRTGAIAEEAASENDGCVRVEMDVMRPLGWRRYSSTLLDAAKIKRVEPSGQAHERGIKSGARARACVCVSECEFALVSLEDNSGGQKRVVRIALRWSTRKFRITQRLLYIKTHLKITKVHTRNTNRLDHHSCRGCDGANVQRLRPSNHRCSKQ